MHDLTLEQEAALVAGAGFWSTAGIESTGIPSVVVADGPHGVRLPRGSGQAHGIGDSVPARCFPPAVGLALGEASRAEGVGVGPGVNITRSPLCGRNFECTTSCSPPPWICLLAAPDASHSTRARPTFSSIR